MTEKKYRVYRYQNLIVPSGNYIGCTCKRNQSERAGKDGQHYIEGCPKFGPTIIEYGWSNFEYSVLEDGLTKEQAYAKERYYIDYYDALNHGYNIASGGSGKPGVHHVYSSESRRKMSESHKGNQHSDETKKKMSESRKKKVLRFTKDGQFMDEYPSIREAGESLGIASCHISQCCSGKRKSAGGSVWRYAS